MLNELVLGFRVFVQVEGLALLTPPPPLNQNETVLLPFIAITYGHINTYHMSNVIQAKKKQTYRFFFHFFFLKQTQLLQLCSLVGVVMSVCARECVLARCVGRLRV